MAFNTYTHTLTYTHMQRGKSEKWKLPLRCHFGSFIENQLTAQQCEREREQEIGEGGEGGVECGVHSV